MDDENFVFSQKVIYHPNSGKLIERPVVLVDFKCSYSGRYQVSFDPIKPTVTLVKYYEVCKNIHLKIAFKCILVVIKFYLLN